MVAKKIQGFHRFVRTDMCESILGLLRLPAEIDRRKLLFLQSLCDMHYRSVPNRIFHFKLFVYIDHGTDNGFIADIFRILYIYRLHEHFIQYAQTLQFPGKHAWKRIENNAISSYELNLWQQRVNTDNNFIRQLQLTISPATLYSRDATMKDRATIMYLSKLWVIKPTTVVLNKTF